MPGGSFEKNQRRSEIAGIFSGQKTVDATTYTTLSQNEKDAITASLNELKKNPIIIDVIRQLAKILRDMAGQPEAEIEKAIRIALGNKVEQLTLISQDYNDLGFFPTESPIQSESELRAVLAIIKHLLELNTPTDIQDFITSGSTEKQVQDLAGRERHEVLRSMPNDFFRYLVENGFSPDDLNREAPAHLSTPEQREQFYFEDFRKMGELVLSTVLADPKFKNDFKPNTMGIPTLGGFHLKRIPEGEDKDYSVSELFDVSDEGLSGERKRAAEKMRQLFIDFFNINDIILLNAEKFRGAANDLSALESFFAPLEDAKKHQESHPTWFERYFFTQIFESLGQIHLWYMDEHHEWQRSVKSTGQQFLEATKAIIVSGTSFYPEQSREITLPVGLSTERYREQLWPGTAHLIGEEKGERKYIDKVVRRRFAPAFKLFPFAQEPDPDKKVRRKLVKENIDRSLGSSPTHKDSTITYYMTSLSANMLDVLLESAYQDTEIRVVDGVKWDDLFVEARYPRIKPLSPASLTTLTSRTRSFRDDYKDQLRRYGYSNNAIDIRLNALPTEDDAKMLFSNFETSDQEITNTLAQLGFDGAFINTLLQEREASRASIQKSIPGLYITNDDLKKAFTVRDRKFVPSQHGLRGYDQTFSGLTDIELWALEGKIQDHPNGVRYIDKIMNLDTYADKAIVRPETQSTEFQTRAIGMVKTHIYPFLRYFRDNSTGRTLRDIIVDGEWGGSGPKDWRHLIKAVPEEAQFAYNTHFKDAALLTKITMNGSFTEGSTLLNLGEIDYKTSVAGKINEKLVASIRGWHQVVWKYQLKRDADPKMVSPLKGENTTDQAIKIRLINRRGQTVEMTTRIGMNYHIDPQSFYEVLDEKDIKEGVSYAVQKYDQASGHPVFEIKLASDRQVNKEALEQIVMRDILKKFIYINSGMDLIKQLKTKDLLILGMIFSEEMRENFKRGKYSRGPITRGLVSVISKLGLPFLPRNFFAIEVPDIVGANLLTEEVFFRIFIQAGYIRSREDFMSDLENAGKEIVDLFK